MSSFDADVAARESMVRSYGAMSEPDLEDLQPFSEVRAPSRDANPGFRRNGRRVLTAALVGLCFVVAYNARSVGGAAAPLLPSAASAPSADVAANDGRNSTGAADNYQVAGRPQEWPTHSELSDASVREELATAHTPAAVLEQH